MILLISPAKTLDFDPIDQKTFTQPELLSMSKKLVKVLKTHKADDLRKLMSVSEKIADLNVERFNSFKTPFTLKNAKQAIFAFQGDVYRGLQASEFDKKELNFAQKHLRILSGLYGVLKPMDLMQAYRLEMGTKLENEKGSNLYSFWDDKITKTLNADAKASKSKAFINLASNEYFKSIKKDKLDLPIYDIHFKEKRNGQFKIISFSAKKARGLMSYYVIKNKLKNPEDLTSFNLEEYKFNPKLSSERSYTFTR